MMLLCCCFWLGVIIPLHCECLATACLSVREDCTVKPLECIHGFNGLNIAVDMRGK